MAVFTIEVTNTGGMTDRQVRTLLDHIINDGLSVAVETLEEGSGDMDMAHAATEVNISAPILVQGE